MASARAAGAFPLAFPRLTWSQISFPTPMRRQSVGGCRWWLGGGCLRRRDGRVAGRTRRRGSPTERKAAVDGGAGSGGERFRGCICILITVVDAGARLFGVSSMSSNYHRISSVESPHGSLYMTADIRLFG